MCICGDSRCRGLCDINVGRKMYAFYKQIEDKLRDSSIGSTKIDTVDKNRCLYVKGYEFYDPNECKRSNDYSDIYTTTSLMTVVENAFDTTASEIGRYAEAYTNFKRMNVEEALKFKNDMMKLARRSKIIIPADFKDAYDVNVYKDGSTKVKYKYRGKLEKIKWVVDNDTHKIECLLRFKIDSRLSKEVHIEDYGIEYFNKAVDSVGTAGAEKAVKMSRFGYIQPLVVENATGILAIDNSGIYYGTANYNVREIGYWEGNTLNLTSTEVDRDLLEFVKKYKSYIAMNRTKMAPYLVGVANEVKI